MDGLRTTFKVWRGHWLEMLVGAVILQFSVKWFLFFAFCCGIFFLVSYLDHLRALLRVFQISNEVAMHAIREKLEITQEDIKRHADACHSRLTGEQRETVRRDWRIVLGTE